MLLPKQDYKLTYTPGQLLLRNEDGRISRLRYPATPAGLCLTGTLGATRYADYPALPAGTLSCTAANTFSAGKSSMQLVPRRQVPR